MSEKERPMLSIDEQIEHLILKGVKFEKITVEDAKQYLIKNNNYFKLRAYRKNFPKEQIGTPNERYINLDFAMLKDLSIIDKRLRYILVQLALDVEHFAKVKLLRHIEQSGNDGSTIVKKYMQHLVDQDLRNETFFHAGLLAEIERNRNNPYCGGIIENYDPDYPVWAFLEIVPLGTFLHFYSFCADILESKQLKNDYYLLKSIKPIRNAAAHSNCILHEMGARDNVYSAKNGVIQALSSISKGARDRQLHNVRMCQIVTLLYFHSQIVTSVGVHEYARDLLQEFKERMFRHANYYAGNQTICSSFDFLKKSIDILFE